MAKSTDKESSRVYSLRLKSEDESILATLLEELTDGEESDSSDKLDLKSLLQTMVDESDAFTILFSLIGKKRRLEAAEKLLRKFQNDLHLTEAELFKAQIESMKKEFQTKEKQFSQLKNRAAKEIIDQLNT